jgi:hypothetical protein
VALPVLVAVAVVVVVLLTRAPLLEPPRMPVEVSPDDEFWAVAGLALEPRVPVSDGVAATVGRGDGLGAAVWLGAGVAGLAGVPRKASHRLD